MLALVKSACEAGVGASFSCTVFSYVDHAPNKFLVPGFIRRAYQSKFLLLDFIGITVNLYFSRCFLNVR